MQTLLKSLKEAEVGLEYIKEKTNFWNKHRDKELNPRQIKVLNKILDLGSKNFEVGL